VEKKQFFKNLKKKSIINYMMNVLPKFQSCRMNGVATIERKLIGIGLVIFRMKKIEIYRHHDTIL